MLAWIAWLPVFGIIVFVHELGHFLAAKLTGVYAPRFSIGFGRPLWRRRWGETEYVLAALPLGGYVRMASRDDEASAFIEGGSEEQLGGAEVKPVDWDESAMMPFGPHPVPEDRWFESKPLPQRLLIMLAGVAMNGILALAVCIGMAMAYGQTIIPTRVIGGITPVRGDSTAGLRVGDTIVAVGTTPVATWNDVERRLDAAGGDSVAIRTTRGPVTAPLGRETDGSALSLRLSYWVAPVVDSVLRGHPAARAGLQRGDTIVAVDGRPVQSFWDLVRIISASPGRALGLDIHRGGSAARVTVRPDSARDTDPATGAPRVIGQIGVVPPDLSQHRALSVGEAVQAGARQTGLLVRTVFDVLAGLVTRRVSVSQLGGPIAIAKSSVAAARSGLRSLLWLLAFLSVNIAVFNLLPIPLLDGGQVVMTVLESVKGRPFSVRTRELVLRAGLLLIGLVFVTAMWNDLSRVVAEWVH